MNKKVLLKIYKWVILSVILQVAVLLFFNNFYLSRRSTARATPVENGDQPSLFKKKLLYSTQIPEGAKDPQVSFDDTLVCYLLDGKLQIYDIQGNKSVKSIAPPKKDIITDFNWLADRRMVIYSLRAPDDETGAVQVVTYNVDTGSQHDYPRINQLPKASVITQIELSHLTNTIYVMVKTSATEGRIYRYNVMSQLYFITSTSADTIIKEKHYKDQLVYQGKDGKLNLFTWSEPKGSTAVLQVGGQPVLLGFAGADDEIYVGELNSNNLVQKIYHGKTTDAPDSDWKSITVKNPVGVENLILTVEGNIYGKVNNKKAIVDISGNKEIPYEGTLIEVRGNRIISLDGNILKISEK